MADRRSVYTNEEIIARSAAFVCAADEVWRLQRGSESDCVFFQKAVNRGERITDVGTRQGTWVFAPSGRLLAHGNTRHIERMLEILDHGLSRWSELTDEEKRLPAGVDFSDVHRWESNFPTDGLALERVGRELADADGTELGSWNMDYAWFSGAELAEELAPLVNGAEEAELSHMAMRLARFHLIDNVRGQSLPFAPTEVERARLTARVVARESGSLELELTGDTQAVADGPWLMGDNIWKPKETHPHGLECELRGRAVWNTATRRFDAFELVGVARRWGRTVMNGRSRDASPGYLAFSFEPSPRRIAPAFVDVYDADWIVAPDVPTWRDSPKEIGLTKGH